MKHNLYGFLAVIFSLLLAFQLPLTSLAAAEEAAPSDSEEASEGEEIYYANIKIDNFSFDINWDWDKETEKLDYGSRTVFSAEDGFSVSIVSINLADAELVIKDFLEEEYPEADPANAAYLPSSCCILSGISRPEGEDLQTETIDVSGYQDLSDAFYWYIYDEESYVKGGFFTMDEYMLIIAADCAALTPAEDTALTHMLATVEWQGPVYDDDDDDFDDDDFDDPDDDDFDDPDDDDDFDDEDFDDPDDDEDFDDDDDQYEEYEFDGFSFEINRAWEIEKEELYEGCSRVTFTLEDGYSFGVASMSRENSQDIIYAVSDELPELDFSSDDANHRLSCYLCGVDCPSGKGLTPSELDVSSSYDDLDTGMLYFIYDHENYAKGGVFSTDSCGIIIAADCTDLSPAHDAAVMRVISTIDDDDDNEKAESEANPEPVYHEITVPEIEQNELAIDPITPNTDAAEAAEFITYNGNVTAKEQKDVYSFTAPRYGRYRVDFSDMMSGFELALTVYDSQGQSIAKNPYCSNGKGMTLKGLAEGETYEIVVKQSRNLGSYTMSIGLQKETVDISDLTAFTDSMEYTDQRNVYAFTPARDGRYRFELMNTQSGIETILYVYNSLNEELAKNSYTSNGKGLTLKGLSADETYQIVVCQSKKFGEYTLMVGQQKETADISGFTLVSDSIEYTDQRNVYNFTVPRDGRYRFDFAEMENGFEVELYIFNDLGESVAHTDYGSNGKGLTLQGLVEGEEYNIQVRQKKRFGSYQLLIGEQKETIAIAEHDIIHDSIEYTDQRNVYMFTAEADGDYTFTLSDMNSGFEVELIAFNHLGETLARDSYGKNGSYISVKNVTRGDTIELQIRQSRESGSYTLTVN